MAQEKLKQIHLRAVGLYSYANQFNAPEGAFSACSDVFIDRPGVIESRRDYTTTNIPGYPSAPQTNYNGLEYVTTSLSSAASSSPYVQAYNATYPFAWGNVATTDGIQKQYDNAPTPHVTNLAQRVNSSFEANLNLYLNCGGMINRGTSTVNTGFGATYRLDSTGNYQLRGSGMQEAPCPTHYYAVAAGGYQAKPTGGVTANSSLLTSANQRAYRVLFLYKDANKNLVRGAPSGRHVVYAPSANYALEVIGLGALYPGDIVQVYASESIPTGNNEPSDDMRQIYEFVLTATETGRGNLTLNDNVPDSLRGTSLYTNDTQDGILQSEQPPPPAAFGLYFKNTAFYSGVQWPGYSSIVITIIGVTGWDHTTSFTVNGVTYTSTDVGGTEAPASGTFALYTGGTATQNTFNTARSLCRAINYNNTAVMAIYATPPNGTAAQIIIKYFGSQGNPQNGNGSAPATATITYANTNTSGATGDPQVSPTGTITTEIAQCGARLYFSKPSQPEAVPELNYVTIGQTGSYINGMEWLRDSLFIYKTDGLYRVTGTTANDMRVELFDATISTPGGFHKSIAKAGNQIFSLCRQGFISVTESGVNIISRAIEDLVMPFASMSSNGGATAGDYYPCVAAASDVEKKYFVFLQTGRTAIAGSVTYAYNYAENSWVQLAAPSNTIGVGMVPSNYAGKGDYPVFSLSQNVSGSNTSYGIKRMFGISDSSISYANSCTWTYTNAGQNNPEILKRYDSVKILMSGSTAPNQVQVAFSSDNVGSSTTTKTVSSFGSNNVVLCTVPPDHAYAGQLTVKITGPSSGNTYFKVSEVQLSYVEIGERVTRAGI